MPRCYHLLFALLTVPLLAAEQHLIAYNSYQLPPFVTAQGGLAQELVNYLNSKLVGQYRFQLETLPRARMMATVFNPPQAARGIALFLNPRFVGDAERTRFLWSKPLFQDRNLLIFRGRPAPVVKQLSDLHGLRFGAMLESRYQGLDELVQASRISRDDSVNEAAILEKVIAKRVDFTSMNQMSYLALSEQARFRDLLGTSPTPGEPGFTRHILISKANPALASKLDAIISAMPTDPSWRALAKRYRFVPLP